MDNFQIRPVSAEDKDWILSLLKEHWDSEKVISRGKVHNGTELPGFVAVLDGRNVGLITYLFKNNECEIITIDSLEEGKGIGTKLIETVEAEAKKEGCIRIWMITTNDNLEALSFYIKRGYRLVKVYCDALEVSRKLKPQIPKIGKHGISILDEWEFEKILE
jgi:GNAT superfamily N-acetyltransferase